MADLDEEFARFAAELKSVEEATKTTKSDEAAAAPPPLAPPPLAPPPAAQAAQPAAQPVAAPPPLVPPPILPPPPVLPPPPAAAAAGYGAAAAAMGGYGAPAAVGYGGPGMGYLDQQQYLPQQMTGYQPPYGQPDPTQLSYPPAPAAAAAGGRSAPASTTAPADPETLKRLKEELLQQKQADKQAGGAGDKAKPKAVFREAAGKRWVDPTLQEWPDNDFRIFVGDLGNEVNDDLLSKSFQRYPSFAKAKIIRDKRTNKSKGFGIVSLLDGNDFAKALKEMNGKYIGNRPCKLSKSTWNERSAKGGGGGGGGSGGVGNKRKDAHGGGGGGSNKVQKTAPKFKYHVPILRQ